MRINIAAGQGKRIKSRYSKGITKVCGKEMVNHVIDNMRKAEVEDINVIIGKGAELVKEGTKDRNVIIFYARRTIRDWTCG